MIENERSKKDVWGDGKQNMVLACINTIVCSVLCWFCSIEWMALPYLRVMRMKEDEIKRYLKAGVGLVFMGVIFTSMIFILDFWQLFYAIGLILVLCGSCIVLVSSLSMLGKSLKNP